MTTSTERPRLTDAEIAAYFEILTEMDAIPPYGERTFKEDARLDELQAMWEVRAACQHEAALRELAEARQALALAAEALAEANGTLWALRDHCESRGDVAGANTCNQLSFRLRAALAPQSGSDAAREAGEEGAR